MAEEKPGQKSILIVEDDTDLRALYVEVLRDEAFVVDEAADGQIGLAKALENPYDLILLDIMLPKFDGIEILKALKKNAEQKKPVVILLTNLGRESIIKEAFALGADGYIIKSETTPGEVVAEVKKALGVEL